MISRRAAMFLFLLIAGVAYGQDPGAGAPVPEQLRGDQSIFLANGGAPALGRNAMKGSGVLYTSAYKALASIPRFQMVSAPSKATLTCVVALRSSAETGRESGASEPLIVLEFYDVKTHALLWAIDDPASDAFGTKYFQTAINSSMQRVVTELNTLASGSLP